MKTQKNLGIWMDHSIANLFDLNNDKNSRSISSEFTFSMKEEALNRSKSIMHNKEHQMNQAFYEEIAEVILHYDHVLLFGPTDAKLEMHNYLKKDSHFRNIKIDIESADKMTNNKKDAFVIKHFELLQNHS